MEQEWKREQYWIKNETRIPTKTIERATNEWRIVSIHEQYLRKGQYSKLRIEKVKRKKSNKK